MARQLEVLPAALQEAVAATRWYLERDERVAAAYEAELTRVFDELARAPETWPCHHHGTHASFFGGSLTRSCKIYTELVLIIAVAHCKRKPGYWRQR